jgi:hypothetical protein
MFRIVTYVIKMKINGQMLSRFMNKLERLLNPDLIAVQIFIP